MVSFWFLDAQVMYLEWKRIHEGIDYIAIFTSIFSLSNIFFSDSDQAFILGQYESATNQHKLSGLNPVHKELIFYAIQASLEKIVAESTYPLLNPETKNRDVDKESLGIKLATMNKTELDTVIRETIIAYYRGKKSEF